MHGIVTGVDDLYGSNFSDIFKADSGISIQEATHDPQATTSEALFVAGIRRDAANPTAAIGSNITICGQISTKFGLVTMAPNGVGNPMSPTAKEVDLSDVATINSTGNALPAPVDIDPARAASQDPTTRPYYRSLQGMRVRLAAGIATGGGTTKFRDVFLRPAPAAQRLFRKNSAAADHHAVVGRARRARHRARRRRRQSGRPAAAGAQRHAVDLDLFDVVQTSSARSPTRSASTR